MKPLPLIALACCLSLVGGMAMAQPPQSRAAKTAKAKSGKIYRWVDAQGKVHFGDTLPDEAIERGRTEYGKNGRRAGEVAGAVAATPVPAVAVADAAQVATQAPPQGAAIDAAPGAKPGSMPPVEAAPDPVVAAAALAEQRRSLEEAIATMTKALAKAHPALVAKLDQAGNLELAGKPVPRAMAAQIQDMAGQVHGQRRSLEEARGQLHALVSGSSMSGPTATVGTALPETGSAQPQSQP